jgi:hypothetical protein
VKYQWPEGQYPALIDQAIPLSVLLSKSVDVGSRETSKPMRSIDHTNWSVVGMARIEMKPNRQHLLEDGNRRLHVWNVSLLGPGTETGHLLPFTRRDGEVLVPDDLPVRSGRLVEEECANREAGGAKDRSGE